MAKVHPAMEKDPLRDSTHAGEIYSFLKLRVALLKRVPDEAVRELARSAMLRRFDKNEQICRTGDAAREIWIVREGRLCVHQCGWKGSILSIEIMVPGDVSGLAAVACRTYPGDVTATQPTQLIAIPREVVLRAIERHPELAREILYAYGQRIHYVETLLYLSKEPAERRVVAALLYLFHKFGFTVPLSRAEIGQMAWTSPETAIRVICRLQKKGYLQGARGRVSIRDIVGLKSEMGPNSRF